MAVPVGQNFLKHDFQLHRLVREVASSEVFLTKPGPLHFNY